MRAADTANDSAPCRGLLRQPLSAKAALSRFGVRPLVRRGKIDHQGLSQVRPLGPLFREASLAISPSILWKACVKYLRRERCLYF